MVRRIVRPVIAAVACVLMTGTLRATLIVDAPQQIIKQVTVQLIQTALDNGTSPATVFGDASQRANIEGAIDSIWAQAGIDINILPTITHYNNTFAYQGASGAGMRPQSDLNTILSNAASAGGILNSDSLVLNLFLVNVVPGFAPLSENSAAGLARISANGITGYVGDALLTFDDGRDVIAAVFAHEIGHNLGLNHPADGIANLMSPNGTSQQLTASQITTARSSNFARLFSPPLNGDYNHNGVVDAADYIVWRKTLNQVGPGLPADGNSSGSVDAVDYTVWRRHLGLIGSGFAVGDSAGLSPSGIGAASEPNSIVCLILALPLLFAIRRRTSR